MSVSLRFCERSFRCDCGGEGSDIFHRCGAGYRCSGCTAFHKGSFVVMENPLEMRIKQLEESLEEIRSTADNHQDYQIVELVNKVLPQ